MSDLIWTKDGDHYTATEGGAEFFVYKTHTCPATPIKAASRWMLDVHGPWYMCRCFPRLTDCYAAAERVLAALPILEDGK